MMRRFVFGVFVVAILFIFNIDEASARCRLFRRHCSACTSNAISEKPKDGNYECSCTGIVKDPDGKVLGSKPFDQSANGCRSCRDNLDDDVEAYRVSLGGHSGECSGFDCDPVTHYGYSSPNSGRCRRLLHRCR